MACDRKECLKLIKKIILVVVVLIVVASVAAYFARNMLVKQAVEEGGNYALGVETNLGSANLALRAGSLELNDFQVDNPDGFEAEKFLEIGRGMLDVEAGSILDEEVVVDSLILEGITINLEQNGLDNNVAVIMNHIKQFELTTSSSDSEQNIRVKQAAIRDIKVDAVLSLPGDNQYEKTFVVENISMENIGGADGGSVAEITAEVLRAILAKATTAGNGLLPEGFGKDIGQALSDSLEQIEFEVTDKVKEIGSSLLKGKK